MGNALHGAAVVLRFIATVMLITAMASVFALAVTGGLISGLGAPVTINGNTGNFPLGAGLTANVPWIVPQPSAHPPWQPYNSSNNVITQTTGTVNVLRNSSMASWDHLKFLTKDAPATNPYNIGIASLANATIDNGSGGAGTFLTVSSAPTGRPGLWQRVTDDGNNQLVTTGATAFPSGINLPTCANAAASCALQFSPGTVASIVSGMYVYDVTTPRAIAGNVQVSGVTNATGIVSLTNAVGFGGNASGTTGSGQLLTPGVGNGDTIAFSTVKRGTQIIGFGTCTDPWTVSCHYIVNTSQLVGGETMQTAGGWCIEGMYIIPVGTAGAANAVTCTGGSSSTIVGVFSATGVTLTVSGSLADMIIRWPIDYVDALRFNCATYAGAISNCVNSNTDIQPVTFQVMITYGKASTQSAPYIQTWTPCSLYPASRAGNNICADTWTNATPDLVTTSIGALPNCFESSTPVTCTYAYTWTPTGNIGGYEIEYHVGAISSNEALTIDGFDLKQTPGTTTCVDSTPSSPPCFQAYPGAIDIAEPEADIIRNRRFTQLIGTGSETGINTGNKGFIESASGYALDGTTFLASWPLPAPIRCDIWHTSSKGSGAGVPSACPPPNFYTTTASDYRVFTNSGEVTNVSTIAAYKIGAQSIIVSATAATSAFTTDKPGIATVNNGNPFFMMLDSSVIGH